MFRSPIDFAFLILVSISVSSFRRGVMMEPRYLNLLTKWTFLLLVSRMSSGKMLFSKSFLACLSDAGKNMASDLDFTVFDPRCIIRPKREKCLSRSFMACCSSYLD